MEMARQRLVPKQGEFWTLKSGIGEADLQVTNVNTTSTMDGAHTVNIEGVVMRQRMGEQPPQYSVNTSGVHSGYIADSYSVPAYPTTPNIKFNTGTIKFTIDDKDKGMAVDIKTIDTLDGVKAQIVLSVGTKSVIAYETEAFEDDEDLEKGLTAQVKAKNAAEAHAKTVLKRTFQ